MNGNIAGKVGLIILLIFSGMVVLGSFEIVKEGHVGVVTRFQEATRQFNPGLNWKIPIFESVTEFQTREQKEKQQLTAATKDQLAIGAAVSFNWRILPAEALNIYKKYGDPATFLGRIVEPRVVQSAKEVLGQYTYEEMIQRRGDVAAALQSVLETRIKDFPVIVSQAHFEDVSAPEDFKKSVREKQIAEQDAQREQHKLEQQRLQAQQKVNTAEAEAEAKRLAASAEAFRINEISKANAAALKREGEEIARNPQIVELRRVEAWKEGGSQVPGSFVAGDGGDLGLILNNK